MNNVFRFSNKDEVYDQASLWIARLDRGLSHQEEQDLKAWLGVSAQHRQVLFELASLWDRMGSLARLSSLFPPPAKQNQRTPPRLLAIAASVLVITTLGFLGTAKLAPQSLPAWMAWHTPQLIEGVYDTRVGEHSTVNLPDSSQLVLNTDTLVKVKYTRNSRLVLLERGELHVDVAHDTSRPLSVIVGNKVVQAVGTAFNVQIVNKAEIELIVTEGKVRVAERGPAVDLQAVIQAELSSSSLVVSIGEKIMLGAENANIDKIDSSEIAAKLSWREGNLLFRGETLEVALAEISRYTEVKFEISNDDIRQIRIAGMFKAGDIKGLLATLQKNFSIDYEKITDDRIYLKAM